VYTIKQPSKIIFGKHSAKSYKFLDDCLLITTKGTQKRGHVDYLGLETNYIFNGVEPNPAIETVEEIISAFKNVKISQVIGLGGGSVLDVAKYVSYKLHKFKIMIPTTFGSGSEVTAISVLKVNGRKRSFHDNNLLADIAIIDPYFIKNSPQEIIKNSAIDAAAQCTEGFDSKLGNQYTQFLCKKAFEIIENAILNENYELLPFGSLLAGLGFGNCSTTLGHAISYVFSNEGISHGHALAFTTTVAHRFNNSIFYERFKTLVHKLKFSNIILRGNLHEASELILTDRKHLDNNPKVVTKNDLIYLLNIINSGNALEQF